MRESKVFNISNLDYLREIPDKFFDLVVDDPDYGLGDKISSGGTWSAKYAKGQGDFGGKPTDEYFKELFRISKNQIIWGGNYFGLPANRCFIVWRKLSISETFSMAMCEYAWTSFDLNAKFYESIPAKGDRFHPAQKPVGLYDWTYKMFLPNGGKVFDGHLGSGSNRIAAYKAGNIDFYACEIDKGYFEESDRRFNNFVSVHSPASENPITFEGQHKLF